MAYGITSESQLMDINRIRNGCEAYEKSLDYFIEAGKQIIEAGDICDKRALAVDNSSMQPVLHEVGQMVVELSEAYSTRVKEVFVNAVNVYNAQVAELNAYYQRLAAEQEKKNNSGN